MASVMVVRVRKLSVQRVSASLPHVMGDVFGSELSIWLDVFHHVLAALPWFGRVNLRRDQGIVHSWDLPLQQYLV